MAVKPAKTIMSAEENEARKERNKASRAAFRARTKGKQEAYEEAIRGMVLAGMAVGEIARALNKKKHWLRENYAHLLEQSNEELKGVVYGHLIKQSADGNARSSELILRKLEPAVYGNTEDRKLPPPAVNVMLNFAPSAQKPPIEGETEPLPQLPHITVTQDGEVVSE
jgi:hypothetical protein